MKLENLQTAMKEFRLKNIPIDGAVLKPDSQSFVQIKSLVKRNAFIY